MYQKRIFLAAAEVSQSKRMKAVFVKRFEPALREREREKEALFLSSIF